MRKYLIAGLLVWVPLGVTVLVVRLVVDLLDRTVLLLPPDWRPDAVLGFSIPGFGIVLALGIVLFTGILVANFLGRRLVALWETVLAQIPLVRNVYQAAKQVVETVFGDRSQAFRKVLLVQFPKEECWVIGFQAATDLGEVQEKTGETHVLSVFVPTAPNPTSGFLLLVPKDDVIELEMSVDEAFQMIISMGTSVPKWPRPQKSNDAEGKKKRPPAVAAKGAAS